MSEPKKPDKTGIALLQARHVLNEMENMQIRAMEMDKDSWKNVNPVEGYPWGLFKTTLLKAMKDREDLKEWSPHVFHGDKVCHHCEGRGMNPIPHDHPQYLERVDESAKTEEAIAKGEQERGYFDNPFKMGDPLFWHCSPCQGSGVLTKFDQVWEDKHPEYRKAK